MVLWRGLELRFSKSAYHELARYGLDSLGVLQVLEEGVETDSRRASGVVEKCLRRKNGLVKVVACESLDYSSGEMVWVVSHVAVIRTPKRR